MRTAFRRVYSNWEKGQNFIMPSACLGTRAAFWIWVLAQVECFAYVCFGVFFPSRLCRDEPSWNLPTDHRLRVQCSSTGLNIAVWLWWPVHPLDECLKNMGCSAACYFRWRVACCVFLTIKLSWSFTTTRRLPWLRNFWIQIDRRKMIGSNRVKSRRGRTFLAEGIVRQVDYSTVLGWKWNADGLREGMEREGVCSSRTVFPKHKILGCRKTTSIILPLSQRRCVIAEDVHLFTRKIWSARFLFWLPCWFG